MSNSDKRHQGVAKFQEVMGFAPPQIDDAFLNVTLDHLFADVWARGELSRRERRLITLTVLISFGNESALRLHLNAARRSGDLSDKDIDELIVHLAHYAGWPAAAVASGVMRQLRADGSEPGAAR